MREFLDAIWREGIAELRMFQDGVTHRQWFGQYPEEAVELLRAADNGTQKGYDIFYGVQLRTREAGDSSAIDDYTSILWGDWDPKILTKPGLFATITGLSPKPQIVVDSGNGYHALWLLDRSYPFEEAQNVMKSIAAATGGDHVADKARILRLPGTLNHKTNPPKPVRLLRLDLLAPKHRLSDFYNYADRQFTSTNGGMTFDDLYGPRREQGSVTISGWTSSTLNAPKFGPGERNNSLAIMAGIMLARGLTREQIASSLLHENEVRCNPPLPPSEVVAIANSIERYR